MLISFGSLWASFGSHLAIQNPPKIDTFPMSRFWMDFDPPGDRFGGHLEPLGTLWEGFRNLFQDRSALKAPSSALFLSRHGAEFCQTPTTKQASGTHTFRPIPPKNSIPFATDLNIRKIKPYTVKRTTNVSKSFTFTTLFQGRTLEQRALLH